MPCTCKFIILEENTNILILIVVYLFATRAIILAVRIDKLRNQRIEKEC